MQNTTKEILEKYKDQIKEAITDLKTKGRRHRQIPNILTTLRLLSPFIIIPATILGNAPLTIGAAITFSLTDAVDGFIAKNWNLTSNLGKDLDAITDKVFATTLLIAGAITNPILLCNLGLEAYIASINIKEKLKGKKPESTPAGKAKTVSLFGLMCASLAPASFGISNAILPLSVMTSGWQILTIKSYKNKYDGSNEEKVVRQKNFDAAYVTNYEKRKNKDEYAKTKEYENPSPIAIEEKEPTTTLEELRKMSNFLHQAQDDVNNIQTHESGIQKSKATDQMMNNRRY